MLRGQLDRANRELIEGWAQDTDDPDAPVPLSITIDGGHVATVLADAYRPDLEKAGIASGRHSFSFRLGHLLPAARSTLRIHRASNGPELHGSPAALEAAGQLDPVVMPARALPRDALDGGLDIVSRSLVAGWARMPDHPGAPVSLLVSVNGNQVARVLANFHRADLEQAGFGDGRHAFAVQLRNMSPIEPFTLRIQRESDGRDVPGSPVVLDAAHGFDPGTQDSLAAAIGEPVSDDDIKCRLAFLARQMERLLQMRSDHLNRREERSLQRQLKWRWPGAACPGSASSGMEQMDPGGMPQPGPALPPRALVIDERTPAQDRDAGSHAIVSHMRSLQRLGFAVSFAPADMALAPGTAALEALGIECYRTPWCGAVEEVLRREAGCFDLVYLHRLASSRYVPLIRQHLPRAWVIFSVADLASLRTARQAEVEDRPELKESSLRLSAAEVGVGRCVDAVVTHSSHEAALLRAVLPAGRVHVVPWSVAAAPTPAGFAKRRGLAFIGGYDHAPNVDAAHYLIEEVMPLAWRHDPAITCTLVGSQMPDSLRACAGPLVVVAGQVPRLADILNTVRLTVAPLTYGAGVKGKVLDSLAHGVPCVCTPVAAEGLDLPRLLQQQVSPTPQSLADAILRLHGDRALYGATRRAGLAYVAEAHSDAQVDAALLPASGPR